MTIVSLGFLKKMSALLDNHPLLDSNKIESLSLKGLPSPFSPSLDTTFTSGFHFYTKPAKTLEALPMSSKLKEQMMVQADVPLPHDMNMK